MPHSNTDDGPPHLLAINAGSSSLKFALYGATELLQLRLRRKIERIGLQDTTLTVNSTGIRTQRRVGDVFDHSGAARELTDWLERRAPPIRSASRRPPRGARWSEL